MPRIGSDQDECQLRGTVVPITLSRRRTVHDCRSKRHLEEIQELSTLRSTIVCTHAMLIQIAFSHRPDLKILQQYL